MNPIRTRLYSVSPHLLAVALALYNRTPLSRWRRFRARARMRKVIASSNAAALALLRAHGYPTTHVLGGSFKGMTYGDVSSGSLLAPKLLGIYEAHLGQWIEEAIAQPYSTILDLGCAEGFYAVGFALRSPSSQVIASDVDPAALKALQDLAHRNGVSDRVHAMGLLDPCSLAHILPPGSLVFCDIEGAEERILDPTIVPVLKQCDMIVELHEHLVPGTMHELVTRFAATHRIDAIWADMPRARLDTIRSSNRLAAVPADQQLCLIDEGRARGQSWLRLRSHSTRLSVPGS